MKLQPIRIALIEPNGADVQWFRHSAQEAGVALEVIHYSTGVRALEEWADRATCTVDLIVVTDSLPMVTAQDVIEAARTVHPDVRVAVMGEQTRVPVEAL